MKIETFIVIVSLLLVAFLGGMAGLNTVVGAQQLELEQRQEEIAELQENAKILKNRLNHVPYTHPLPQGWISSDTGYRVDPMGGAEEALHKGVDLSAEIGTPVKAILAGVVAEHWPPPDGYYRGHPVYGGLLVIKHGSRMYSLYGHLHATYVHTGEVVEIGQTIGSVGNTGISTGPHLHFELVVDPFVYLEGLRNADRWGDLMWAE